MNVRQAANVLELLEFFAQRGQPATLAEIADGLGWPRSSTFNLVGTLAGRGYLYEPQGRAGYFPTARWLEMARAIIASDPLPVGIEDSIAELAAETGETVALTAPAGVSAIFRHVVASSAPIRYSAEVGNLVPIHATSCGRALLAQYSPSERKSLYRKIDFVRFTNFTPGNADEVEAILAQEMQQGFHLNVGGHVDGLQGVAMPLAIPGRPLALLIGGPTFRCSEQIPAFAAALRNALARIAKIG